MPPLPLVPDDDEDEEASSTTSTKYNAMASRLQTMDSVRSVLRMQRCLLSAAVCLMLLLLLHGGHNAVVNADDDGDVVADVIEGDVDGVAPMMSNVGGGVVGVAVIFAGVLCVFPEYKRLGIGKNQRILLDGDLFLCVKDSKYIGRETHSE